MPHSGPHFLRFWCDLVQKSLILGAPWRPAGSKMATKIAQMAPKWCIILSPGLAFHTTFLQDCSLEPSWAPYLRIFNEF